MESSSNPKSAKPSFRFQRFSISDHLCGMKVGTDGVLLGAWINVEQRFRILDIGTGSGLIALMLAQRTEKICGEQTARIEALEIDGAAAAQAADNFFHTPWRDRIWVWPQSLQSFVTKERPEAEKFDLLVCNPPFFQNSMPAEQRPRQVARHATELSRSSLFAGAVQLLTPQGCLGMIIPFDQLATTNEIALSFGLQLRRQTSVRPLPGKPFKRVLLEYQFDAGDCIADELIVEQVRHEFTKDYEQLTRDFHLRFATNR